MNVMVGMRCQSMNFSVAVPTDDEKKYSYYMLVFLSQL